MTVSAKRSVMDNLEPLENLRKLFIGGNAIQEIRGLENCRQLEELHVQVRRVEESHCAVICAFGLCARSNTLLVDRALAQTLRLETR